MANRNFRFGGEFFFSFFSFSFFFIVAISACLGNGLLAGGNREFSAEADPASSKLFLMYKSIKRLTTLTKALHISERPQFETINKNEICTHNVSRTCGNRGIGSQ